MTKWSLYEKSWFSIFSAIAIVIAYLQKDSLIGIATFITGILCVLLAAKGNIWTYAFGIFNTLAYAYISYINGFFGEVGLNLLFFMPMNILGFLFWRKRLHNNIVEMRRLKIDKFINLMLICLLLTIIMGFGLSFIKGQNVPYIDASTNVLSVAATFLMVLRYREQWFLYIILNVITIIMWIIRTLAGSSDGLMMIIMWVAFLSNAVYGYYLWTKGADETKKSLSI